MIPKRERQQLILQELQAKGHVLVTEVSARFGISHDTARRDLAELRSGGKLRRAYRGALVADRSARTVPGDWPRSQHEDAAIARCAADLVKDGDPIYLGPGKLSLLLARQIRGRARGLVVTNSILIAKELNALEGTAEIVLVGGVVCKDHFATSGSLAEKGLSQLRVKWAFVSGELFTLQTGQSDRWTDQTGVFHSICEISRQVVLLARASELGRNWEPLMAHPGAVQMVISSRTIPQAIVDPLQLTGIQVLLT